MNRTKFLIYVILALSMSALLAADQIEEKKRVAVVEVREDISSAELQWRPSDFEKRMRKAIEKTGKFEVLDSKKVDGIRGAEKHFGRLTTEQEGKLKDLGADYIIYPSMKRGEGNVLARSAAAMIVLGLTVVDLRNSKESDEMLVSGEASGVGQPGELDYGDRDFKRRDEIERMMDDAGKRAVSKAAQTIAAWNWTWK